MYPSFLRTARGLATERLLGSFFWLGAAAVLLGAWTAWLFWARLPVIESSDQARVEYENPPFGVSVPVAGRIAASRLVLHRQLAAGEVLLELDSTVEKRRLVELRVRQQSLSEQLQGIEAELQARKGALRAEKLEARAGHEAAVERERGARERARLAETEAERFALLRGQVAELEVLRTESLARQRSADLGVLEHEARKAGSQLLLRRRYGQLQLTELRNEQLRLLGELASTAANLATLDAEVQRRSVRAPYAGRIAATRPLAVGSLVQAGEILATMLPDAPLRVVALLSPAAALGRVGPGQSAWLRLHGFPFTQYGRLPLRVLRRADELQEGLVRIELEILNGGAGFPISLSHGLPGSVDIAVETGTPRTLLLRTLGRLLAPAAPSFGGPRT